MAHYSTLDLLDVDDGELDDRIDYGEDGVPEADRDDHAEPHGVEDRGREAVTRRRASTARGLFAVHGEATGTRLNVSKQLPKKRPSSATSTRANAKAYDGGNQSSHATADAGGGARVSHEAQVRLLQEQLEQCRRELAHSRDEREELQVAFRRLDQEIVSGYNLTERKEKELRIAELLAKNQKLSQMLEKELKLQETLRAANADLQSEVKRQEQQTTLLNQVLSSLEAKHASLVDVNGQLTTTCTATQHQLFALQDKVVHLEAQASDSSSRYGTDYDEKLQALEAKCIELQRKLDTKSVQLRAEQERVKALERACEKSFEENGNLETEIAGVHDKLIHMSGAMTTMEARIEATEPQTDQWALVEHMKQRIRLLEEETVSKNRLITDLRETVDSMLNGESHGQRRSGTKRPLPGAASGMRAESASSRIVTLTQRLRKMEESRDHKGRSLDVLLAVLPQLLRQLDALQDKFQAAVESNAILSDAIEQLQSHETDNTRLLHEPVVALAREKFLLSGPYQPELLMGYTLSRALSEAAPPPPRKQARFMPFQVRTHVSISENSQAKGQMMLAAEADDPSGAAFLNRCKINAFLHLVHGKAAQAKCKQLLVQKIADLLSVQRELAFQYSNESGYFKVLIAKLEREILQVTKKLSDTQAELESIRESLDHLPRRGRHNKLILRLFDTVANNSQFSSHNTFLTQNDDYCLSDRLVFGDQGKNPKSLNALTLDLSDCEISDDDLEPLLLKLSVSSARVSELDLSNNLISDDGAATLSAFLETCPSYLKILSVRGNRGITSDGVSRLKAGLMKNRRVHRVDMDAITCCLQAVAANQEFDTAGRPSTVLLIHLPTQKSFEHGGVGDQDESVEAMVQELEGKGFCGTASSMTRAEAVYRQPRQSLTKKPASAGTRVGPSKLALSSSRTRARGLASQQETKFRALEAALRKADDSPSHSAAGSSKRGVTLTQMQYLLQHPGRSTSTPDGTASSRRRMSKLHFAQSHLATIRDLGKR